LVVKFGGSSLADGERIGHAVDLVERHAKRGDQLAVVVSAIGRTTDQLLGIVKGSTPNGVAKTDLDDVLAMGERTSVRILSTALKSRGLAVRYFDPDDRDWPIVTDSQFSNANPMMDACIANVRMHVLPLVESGTVPVIPGFVGRTEDGKVSTIGRGGGDATAFILARGIGADEVVLVTDSDGILSADPKLVPSARKLEKVDVRTLVKLADSGTKFIHRKALRYKPPDIPVRVIKQNETSLDEPGTLIVGGFLSELEISLAEPQPCMSITIAGKAISQSPALVEELVEEVRKNSVLLGMSADFDSVILYVAQSASNPLVEEVHNRILASGEAIGMAVRENLAFVRIAGVGLEETPGLIRHVGDALGPAEINIFGMLTLASSILVFVSWDDKEMALQRIKEALR
jgi:aspartate kinase